MERSPQSSIPDSTVTTSLPANGKIYSELIVTRTHSTRLLISDRPDSATSQMIPLRFGNPTPCTAVSTC